MTGPPIHGRCIEEVRIVFEGAIQAPVLFLKEQRQVEHGVYLVDRLGDQFQVRQTRQFGVNVLQDDHHLEQRRITQVAFRLDRIDHLLEGDVLMVIGVQRGNAGTRQEFAETGIARKVVAQHQGVHKEADQGFDFRLSAIGDRSPQTKIFGAGIAGQLDGKGRFQNHEKRYFMSLGERLQAARQVGG